MFIRFTFSIVSSSSSSLTHPTPNENEKNKRFFRKYLHPHESSQYRWRCRNYFLVFCFALEGKFYGERKIETFSGSSERLRRIVDHLKCSTAERHIRFHCHSPLPQVFSALRSYFNDFSTRSNMALCALTPLWAFSVFPSSKPGLHSRTDSKKRLIGESCEKRGKFRERNFPVERTEESKSSVERLSDIQKKS